MGTCIEILKVLNCARLGLTAGQVRLALPDTDNLSVYLSALKGEGLTYTDGKNECNQCGSTHVVYRITKKGRIHLREKFPVIY